jgi:hypothetical protein
MMTFELLCRLRATSFTGLSSCSFIGHYMFRPDWPSSGVQVVMVKNSAAHCNAGFFPPTVFAFGYFDYVNGVAQRRHISSGVRSMCI